MANILIADPIPLLNKGEQALLEGIVESLDTSCKKPYMALLSPRPKEDVHRSRVRVIDRCGVLSKALRQQMPGFAFLIEGGVMALLMKFGRSYWERFFARSELWRAVLASDVIIVGHDSSVSYDAIIVGWLLNKPLAIFAGSIEMFRSKYREMIAKTLLKKVHLITLREEDSYKALDELGIISMVKAQVTADAAFLLRPCSPERVKEIMRQEGLPAHGRPMVGVTLTRQMCERSHPEISDIEERYARAIADKATVLDKLIEQYNVEIVFVPHCIGPGKNDDRLVASDVIRLMKSKDMIKSVVTDFSASELKGLISRCEIFIGERTHSVIAALSQGIPSVCMTFPTDRRTHGIIGGTVGQKEFIYNVERLNPEELLLLIGHLWAKKQDIRTELKGLLPSIKDKALQSASLVQSLIREDVKSNDFRHACQKY